ncbi:MAG: N-acetyltransferase [Bacteroidota bacterium]
MGLTLRKCTVTDVQSLAKIARSTFIDAFEEANEPTDFYDYLDQAFSVETLASELKSTESAFYFVFDQLELAGYFKLNEDKAQTDIGDVDSLELERIYVVKKFQGKKIGKWMLDHIMGLASAKSKTYVWLGVWEHNPDAIRFYEKYGFKKFGTHPYFIGNDQQTDWLMRYDVVS